MNCPDAKASKRTSESTQIGLNYTGFFDNCDSANTAPDVDWIKVELDYGQTYDFQLSFDAEFASVPPRLTIAAQYGLDEDRLDRRDLYFNRYTARYSGTHYIQLAQGDLPNGTEYLVTTSLITNETVGETDLILLVTGFHNHDTIEESGDEDTFRVQLYGDRSYEFVMNGQSGNLSNTHLELRDQQGNLVAQHTSPDSHSTMSFSPSKFGNFNLVVSADGTGDYNLIAFSPDDAKMGIGSTSEMVFDDNGRAFVQGEIEQASDIDWHTVNLTQGELIKVTMVGSTSLLLETPTLIIRDNNRDVVFSAFVRFPDPTTPTLETYYEARESGTHYVIGRTNISQYIGRYELLVEKTRTPIEQNVLFGRGDSVGLLTIPGQSINLNELVDLRGLTPNTYEVYASTTLHRDGQQMDANQVYSIPASELGLWRLSDAIDGRADLFIRAQVSNSMSEWKKFPVFGADKPIILNSENTWPPDQAVTYRFVTELPDGYDPNRFTNFSSLSSISEITDRIEAAFDGISNSGLHLSFAAAADGEAADMDIFMASGFTNKAASKLPGVGIGGDLILNSDFYSGSTDLSDGSLYYFNIVRHIAHAIGLNFTNGATLESSIMSANNTNASGLFPSTLAINDLLALQEMYGTSVYDPGALPPGGQANTLLNETIRTIAVETNYIGVDPSFSDQDVLIDLRSGGRSFFQGENAPGGEIYVGPGAYVKEAALGGSGNDTLAGNSRENRMLGGEGDDFLIGYEMHDEMSGGAGDDIYIHYFGDGNDFISDIGGGTDTLCFIGLGDFHVDDLATDYTFTLRNGNELRVDLTLDGGQTEGSVSIFNGFDGSQPVEVLELYHEMTRTSRISMVSIMDQLQNGVATRFQIGTGSDEFGSLVSPI